MIDTAIRIIDFAQAATTIVGAALSALKDGDTRRADEILPEDLATSVAIRAAEAKAQAKLGPRPDDA